VAWQGYSAKTNSISDQQIKEVNDVSATDPATIKFTDSHERFSRAANITRATLAIKLSAVCIDGLI
jgi:hypothetical protein